MSTFNQLLKGARQPKKSKKVRLPCFVKGICTVVSTCTPKKPNSAQRKIAKVKTVLNVQIKRGTDNYKHFKLNKTLIAKIPGEGHNLREHSKVVLKRLRAKDTPGVKFTVIRGSLDSDSVKAKKQGRSKVGTKMTAKK
jgi:small subunit ribosomal protein S12